MNIEDIKEGETYNVRVKVIGKYGKCIDAIYADADDAIVGLHIPERRVGVLRPISPENGKKNTETAPKYDPNRKFREGDKVRIKREINGRLLHHSFVNFKYDTVYTVDADEVQKDFESGHVVITDGEHYCSLSFYELELVTPVEDLEPFFISEGAGIIELYKETTDEVVKAWFYDTVKAGVEALAAAEAERDRLNAEYRKEQSNEVVFNI